MYLCTRTQGQIIFLLRTCFVPYFVCSNKLRLNLHRSKFCLKKSTFFITCTFCLVTDPFRAHVWKNGRRLRKGLPFGHSTYVNTACLGGGGRHWAHFWAEMSLLACLPVCERGSSIVRSACTAKLTALSARERSTNIFRLLPRGFAPQKLRFSGGG